MILGAIIQIFSVLVLGFISLLPEAATLPAAFFTAASNLAAPLASVAWFLPVTQLINISLLTIVILLAIFVLRVSLWIISAIRGTNLTANRIGL